MPVSIRPPQLPRWLSAFARAAGDFVYPPACRLCDADLPVPAEPSFTSAAVVPQRLFCAACETALRSTHGPACLNCGASIGPHLDPALPCMLCRNEHYAFERVFRLGVYDGALRTACLKAKARGAEPLAAGLAELVWECESQSLREAQIDVVVPVPQHWTKRLSHPHNAALTAAEVWASRLQVDLAGSILRKVRRTPSQARLTPSERRGNLRRAFAIGGADRFAGATVLLADDVMTTGTTAHEASRVLIHSGARRVVVAVIARGLGRR